MATDGDDVCEEVDICEGLTEVGLWGQSYDIESTTSIDLWGQGLTSPIPPELGCLANLTLLNLRAHSNHVTVLNVL